MTQNHRITEGIKDKSDDQQATGIHNNTIKICLHNICKIRYLNYMELLIKVESKQKTLAFNASDGWRFSISVCIFHICLNCKLINKTFINNMENTLALD